MTLRFDGMFVTVICNGCDLEYPTTQREPVLAWYRPVLDAGWVGSSDSFAARTKYGYGVFCPTCIATAEEATT